MDATLGSARAPHGGTMMDNDHDANTGEGRPAETTAPETPTSLPAPAAQAGTPPSEPVTSTPSHDTASDQSPVSPNGLSTPTPLTKASRPRARKGFIIAAIAVALVLVGSTTTVLILNHRAEVAAQERREAAERKEAAEEKAAEEARREAEEKAAAELAAARAQYGDCTSQLNPLLHTLQKVDARLDVGLNQGDLSDLVGNASIAYNRMDVDELGTGTCLLVAVQLENAFNDYTGTVSRWNDCIFDYDCDTDAITPGLQAKWLHASRAIERAESRLDTLDPDSPNYDSQAAASIA